jgi:hypothetical protein
MRPEPVEGLRAYAGPTSAGLNRFSSDCAATPLVAFPLRLGLALSYGHHMCIVFSGFAADLFWTAVFVLEHDKVPSG